jgi:hypothetical protein
MGFVASGLAADFVPASWDAAIVATAAIAKARNIAKGFTAASFRPWRDPKSNEGSRIVPFGVILSL